MSVPAFGDCGYDSTNRSLIELRDRFPESFRSEEFLQLRNTWSGLKQFRQKLLAFLKQEYLVIMSNESSPVQDWTGHPYVPMYNPPNKPGSTKLIDRLCRRIWSNSFEKWGATKMKPLRHWFILENHAPLICLLFRVSVYAYSAAHYEVNEKKESTRGNCPMKFVFKYASIGKPITQARTHYVTSPSYQMKMEDGWITVMDPVDDMLMLHSVVFEKDNGEPDDYRIAWVYRNLKVEKDFYVETSTIRRDNRMMKTVAKKVKLEGHLRRDIFS
jgi:hypothetical protein